MIKWRDPKVERPIRDLIGKPRKLLLYTTSHHRPLKFAEYRSPKHNQWFYETIDLNNIKLDMTYVRGWVYWDEVKDLLEEGLPND